MATITDLRTQAEAAWRQMWVDPDMETITFIRGAVLACRNLNQSFHLQLTAKPGTGKTTLLSGFESIPWTYTVDSYSANTLFSGQMHGNTVNPNASLAIKLQNDKKYCVINNDFSVVMSNRRVRAAVLSDMRSVIDGRRSDQKGVGSTLNEGGVLFTDKNGKIAFISALTPASLTGWDRDWYQRSMGERSLVWRMTERTSDYNPVEVLDRSTEENMTKVKKSEKSLCLQLLKQSKPSQKDSKDYVYFCSYAANFLAIARTPVIRDSKVHKIESVGDTEEPIRIFKMMISLADGYVISSGLEYGHEEVRSVIHKLCFDSIPEDRSWVLKHLNNSPDGISLPDLIKQSKFSHRAMRNAVEDLRLIGLIEVKKSSTDVVKASNECWEHFNKLFLTEQRS